MSVAFCNKFSRAIKFAEFFANLLQWLYFARTIDPRNNMENTSTRGIRGTRPYIMALPILSQAGWLKFGNLAAKSEQPCAACRLGIRGAGPSRKTRRGSPAGFHENFERLETSFMNATRNFNRFVCHRADYPYERARGKRTARREVLQMRHKCCRALLFPRITLEIVMAHCCCLLLLMKIENHIQVI